MGCSCRQPPGLNLTYNFPRDIPRVSQGEFDDIISDAFSKPVPSRPQVGLHAVHGDAQQVTTALFEGLGIGGTCL
jgi:hypothetical protein